jgi:LCP family protein required for cell wall assembly
MTDLRRSLRACALAFVVAACSTSTPTASPGATLGGPAATRASGPVAPATTTGIGGTTEPGNGQGGPQSSGTSEPATGPIATPGEPTPGATPIAGLDQLMGADGRFTMLLLGSDARRGLAGERTDTIMIATIDPATGRVAFISLPRDTAQVPIGPGRAYGPKINGLFQQYQASRGNRPAAFRSFEKALEYTFGIEIDRYALVHFTGLVDLIDKIGGIDVNLAQPFVDPTSHISKRGLVLHAGVNHLDGPHALAYSRSRHTTTDYDRSFRQQLVIAIAIRKVLGMGIADLAKLAPLAFSEIETDLTIADAPALFALAQGADLSGYKGVVLGPRTFATEIVPLTNELKIGVVRALFKRIFGP